MKLNAHIAKGFFLLTAGIFASGLAITSAGASEKTTLSFNLPLSSIGMDFDEGLDARDEFNRPAADPSAKARLRQLFVGTAFALLTRPELPRMAEFLSALDRAWKLFSQALRRVAAKPWRAVVDLALPSSKKNLVLPWFLALIAVVASAGPLAVSSSQPRKDSLFALVASVVIRC